MKRANEIIASTLGTDIADLNACRYQDTRTPLPIYAVGDHYYCCPMAGKKPPEGWKWVPHSDQFWARPLGRTVYVTGVQDDNDA